MCLLFPLTEQQQLPGADKGSHRRSQTQASSARKPGEAKNPQAERGLPQSPGPAAGIPLLAAQPLTLRLTLLSAVTSDRAFLQLLQDQTNCVGWTSRQWDNTKSRRIRDFYQFLMCVLTFELLDLTLACVEIKFLSYEYVDVLISWRRSLVVLVTDPTSFITIVTSSQTLCLHRTTVSAKPRNDSTSQRWINPDVFSLSELSSLALSHSVIILTCCFFYHPFFKSQG